MNDDKPDVKEYRKEYYRKNKQTIAQSKKERYKTDPDYCAKIKQAALKRKRAKRAQLGDYVERDYQGASIRVRKIGVVATVVGTTIAAIARWESAGVIPRPLFGVVRCYTDKQVALLSEVKAITDTYRTLRLAKEAIGVKVHNEWLGGLHGSTHG